MYSMTDYSGAALVGVAGVSIVVFFRSWAKRLLRAGVHRMVRAILCFRANAYVFKGDVVALVIAPHPDDEALGCGGMILRKCRAGQPVHVLYLTDGSASHPDHPTLSPTRLKVLRAEEARRALGILGVDPARIHFLEAKDGSLNTVGCEERGILIGQIKAVIHQVVPNEIFLPYRRDGSSEHEAAFQLVQSSLLDVSPRPRLLEFPLWSWWSPRLLLPLAWTPAQVLRYKLDGYEAVKWQAIRAYHSQIEAIAPWTSAVLPAGFAQAFHSSDEFFFDFSPRIGQIVSPTADE